MVADQSGKVVSCPLAPHVAIPGQCLHVGDVHDLLDLMTSARCPISFGCSLGQQLSEVGGSSNLGKAIYPRPFGEFCFFLVLIFF